MNQLSKIAPEAVGLSSARLGRISHWMQQQVAQKKLAEIGRAHV